jgi:hypothetical protein
MNEKCWCYECLKDVASACGNFSIVQSQMILCPTCGSKRCPRATDHRLACTNSNDPGQLGSRYGIYPHPSKDLLDFVHSKDD